LVPQAHCPFVEQLSAVLELQAVQACPPTPHVAKPEPVQAFPEQHPEGHDVESHTQLPLRHR
jgi:hypothetical protein